MTPPPRLVVCDLGDYKPSRVGLYLRDRAVGIRRHAGIRAGCDLRLVVPSHTWSFADGFLAALIAGVNDVEYLGPKALLDQLIDARADAVITGRLTWEDPEG